MGGSSNTFSLTSSLGVATLPTDDKVSISSRPYRLARLCSLMEFSITLLTSSSSSSTVMVGGESVLDRAPAHGHTTGAG